jgi:hypothetical protein
MPEDGPVVSISPEEFTTKFPSAVKLMIPDEFPPAAPEAVVMSPDEFIVTFFALRTEMPRDLPPNVEISPVDVTTTSPLLSLTKMPWAKALVLVEVVAMSPDE